MRGTMSSGWGAYKKNTDSGLKKWVHPDGITIDEIINRNEGEDFKTSFKVTATSKLLGKGKRQRRQFRKESEAFVYADDLLNKREEGGTSSFALDVEQTKEATAAFNRLKGTGLTLTEVVNDAVARWKQNSISIKLNEAIEEILSEKTRENKRTRTIKTLRSQLRTLHDILGDKYISEIDGAMMKDVMENQLSNLGPRTWNNYRQDYATFFNWCVNKEYCEKSPMRAIKQITIDWEEPTILTIDQVQTLLGTALFGAARFDHLHLVYLTLELFVGLRSEEICSRDKQNTLQWEDIDLKNLEVEVSSRIAKKRRIRTLAIPTNAAAFLKLSPINSGPVIPMKRYDKQIAKFRKRCGFTNWSENMTNAMRHSFGSYYYKNSGESVEKTVAALGHHPSDSATLFSHYRRNVKKEDAEAYWNITPQNLPRPDILRLGYETTWWKRENTQEVYLP